MPRLKRALPIGRHRVGVELSPPQVDKNHLQVKPIRLEDETFNLQVNRYHRAYLGVNGCAKLSLNPLLILNKL
jgi:hypothetical protein